MHSSPFQPNVLKCDFCSSTPIYKTYDATPIRVEAEDSTVHFIDTGWAACATCAALIDNDHWDELTDRSVALWREEIRRNGIALSSDHLARIRAYVGELHRQFREARKATA